MADQTNKTSEPRVGQHVHFFTKVPEAQRNGDGEGPYAAVITKLHTNLSGLYKTAVNLTIFPSFADPFWQMTIHKSEADECAHPSYWVEAP